MKLLSIAILLLSMFRVEQATAISENELMTADGNIWAVYDELDEGAEYRVTFNNNGTENLYDDVIIRVER